MLPSSVRRRILACLLTGFLVATGALTAVFTNVASSERLLFFSEGNRGGKEEVDVTVTDTPIRDATGAILGR